MQVRQLTIRHISEQDRLLVRLNNADGEEYRLWLTRRMLAIVWPHLEKVVAQANLEAGDVSQDEAGKKLLSEFRKEAALQQADFATPFNDQPSALPLGQQPLLATQVHFALQPDGALEILFEEVLPGAVASRGFAVRLELQLQVGMLRLIENAVEAAAWNLRAGQVNSADAAEPEQRPKYLN
jgi:hypothetical protein